MRVQLCIAAVVSEHLHVAVSDELRNCRLCRSSSNLYLSATQLSPDILNTCCLCEALNRGPLHDQTCRQRTQAQFLLG